MARNEDWWYSRVQFHQNIKHDYLNKISEGGLKKMCNPEIQQT